ncbi:hypothetical protein GCM10023314_07660 [Algibacter agarivorans]|uniref:F5/8 type C domain-containing protein n=1 Tax=Algibacter agarivorans TaxID=1109741 RepID=A0ABP9GC69_9FLAO
MKKALNIIVGLLFFSYSFNLLAQNDTSFYLSPHPDDWQLFMNPNAYQSVKNTNEKVVFIHTTAGDAGSGTGNNNYFLAREQGSLRALRFMSNTFTSGAGLGTNMNETTVTINGHSILKYTYRNIVAYFLRLPDGNPDGSGFALHNFKSLQKLYNGTVSNISAVDNSTTYNSLSDLEYTLKSIIELESSNLNSVVFNLADDDDTINPDDHSDHVYSSKIMQDVADDIGNITLNLYVDYDSGTRAQNVFNDNYLVSAGTWGVTTSGLSDNFHNSTWNNSHNVWIGKQYFRTLGTSTIAFTNTEVIVDENIPVGFARFSVTLTGDISEKVTVDYTTVGGTALSPGDYSTTSGTITFTPTNKSFDIDVPITNDATIETQEAYTVVLSNILSNLELVGFVNGVSSITANGIINDDDSNTSNIALNKPTTASSYEDDRVSSLAVDDDFSLSSWWGAHPYEQWWQVDLLDIYDIGEIIVTNYYDGTRFYQYDIEASLDGINWTEIVDFNDNTTPASNQGNTFNITNTSARYLRVNMNFNSANVGVHIVEFEAYGELKDSGIISFTNTEVITDENTLNGFATFNVTLSGNISENVTIDYTTADGTALNPGDYSTTSGTITFTSTNKSFDIDVPITDDTVTESQESYTLVLSNIVSNLEVEFVNGESTITANGMINDDDSNTSNIALNKPTTASSYEDDRVSSLAVDDDFSLSSWWGAHPYAQWWQVDLLDVYDIGEIIVTNYYDGTRFYQYDIEASIDGINWISIADFNDNTSPATNQGNTFNFTNTSARYLRVNMNFNSANVGVHIVEFEVYGGIFVASKSSTSKTAVLNSINSNQAENLERQSEFQVYPNPVNKGDNIFLELDDVIKGTVLLEVFDIKGASVLRKEIEQNNSKNSIRLNTSTFISGWNIVSLTTNGKTISKKLFIK